MSREKRRAERVGWLRAAALGANDGISVSSQADTERGDRARATKISSVVIDRGMTSAARAVPPGRFG